MCVIITDHSFEICNCSILKKIKKNSFAYTTALYIYNC